MTGCRTHPGRSLPKGADSSATSPPACLLTRSRREVPEAFLSPHTCGSQTPRSLSHPGRLRDFATLRVEKTVPSVRTFVDGTDTKPPTHGRSASQCVRLRKTAFSVVQPPVGVQLPEPLSPQTVRPFFAGQPRVTETWPPAWRCSSLSGAATPPVGSSLAESTNSCATQRHRFGQRRPEACLQYTTTGLLLVQPASPVQPHLVW